MIEVFMIRFEISRMRSKGTKTMMGAGWCTVRQDNRHGQKSSIFNKILCFDEFLISKWSLLKGAHVNTQVSPVKRERISTSFESSRLPCISVIAFVW